jgi:hypothetical protein
VCGLRYGTCVEVAQCSVVGVVVEISKQSRSAVSAAAAVCIQAVSCSTAHEVQDATIRLWPST